MSIESVSRTLDKLKCFVHEFTEWALEDGDNNYSQHELWTRVCTECGFVQERAV